MTKAELVDAIQGTTGKSKKETADVIDAVFGAVTTAIQTGGRFSYPGFGTFTVRERKARTGRNPRTGETLKIPASKTVGFKPAPSLKDSL